MVFAFKVIVIPTGYILAVLSSWKLWHLRSLIKKRCYLNFRKCIDAYPDTIWKYEYFQDNWMAEYKYAVSSTHWRYYSRTLSYRIDDQHSWLTSWRRLYDKMLLYQCSNSHYNHGYFNDCHFLIVWNPYSWKDGQAIFILKPDTGCSNPHCWAEGSFHGPLARYVKLWVAHAPGMPGTFSPSPEVSDPDIHHSTCVVWRTFRDACQNR